jgi:hypothetical protein
MWFDWTSNPAGSPRDSASSAIKVQTTWQRTHNKIGSYFVAAINIEAKVHYFDEVNSHTSIPWMTVWSKSFYCLDLCDVHTQLHGKMAVLVKASNGVRAIGIHGTALPCWSLHFKWLRVTVRVGLRFGFSVSRIPDSREEKYQIVILE